MTSERQHPDASSGDTVFDQTQHKPLTDSPVPEDQTETPAVLQPNNDAQSDNDADNVIEKAEGGPLDRVPSQAAKMGKKQIIVVMTALCVS